MHSQSAIGDAKTGTSEKITSVWYSVSRLGRSLSSVKSHARAIFQSRITVSEDTFTTSAVSFTLRPPKNRSSTIRDLRGSTSARADSASSNATSSARPGLRYIQRLGEIQRLGLAAALARHPAAGPVQQNPAHHRGRYSEKMGPMLPVQLARVHQPQINLVHQVGALQTVAGPLVLQQSRGHPPQFAIDSRSQFAKRFGIAIGPCSQKLSGIGAG